LRVGSSRCLCRATSSRTSCKTTLMASLEIKGFVEASFCDWDGRVATVVFLSGCNLRCPFCQNGDLVLAPERLASLDFARLSSYLERNREWIDGVVMTGGEPTIWDDLPGLARRIKALGFPIKLDTNGTRPAMIRTLADESLLDYVAMDVKAPLDQRYCAATGTDVDVDAVRRSIEMSLGLFGDSCEFRTTLVPGLVGETEVVEIARQLGSRARYVLQQFVPERCLDTALRRSLPYSEDFVLGLVEKAKVHVKSCFFRGRAGAVTPGGGRLV
jgi:pyruvate formate lyase activating enzyme